MKRKKSELNCRDRYEATDTIPSEPIKLGEGTVKIIAIIGSFFLGLLMLGFVVFVIWIANGCQF